MIVRRRIGVSLSLLVALALAAAGGGAGTSSVAGGRSRVAPRVAVVRPFAVLVPTRFASPPTTAACESHTGLACYSPLQIETAYDMNALYAAGHSGAGTTIAIIDAFGSPTIQKDLNAFDKAFGLPAPPSFAILQPVGSIPPFEPTSTRVGWAVETSLDVEYAHAMAPAANILLVETPVAETEGTVGFPQIVAAENYVLEHHLADVISQSFGATEETFPSTQSLRSLRSAFIAAAADHVTVLAGSGDEGATNYKRDGQLYTRPVISWPASDPLVTAVGGTQLHLNQAGDRVAPDNVWNDTNIEGSPAASGGGLSAVFARPKYQNGVASVVGSWRGNPDVSLTAAVDGGALVHLSFPGLSAGFYIVGGTSWATPTFSGIVAIADEVAGHDLGLINPALYALAGQGAPGIVDITTGNNTVTFVQDGKTYTVGRDAATTGYDLASGLGTVDGAQLVAELAGAGS